MKIPVEMSEKINAIEILKKTFPGNSSIATRTPNFAPSVVVAVVGETNLFRDKCCMIRPEILNPNAARINASNLGILTCVKIGIASELPAIASNIVKLLTPIMREMNDSIINIDTSNHLFIPFFSIHDPLCFPFL